MREIYFKGKRVDNNKWIEGSLIVDYPCCKNKVDESVKQYFILDLKTSDEKVKPVQVIPETVGQYTGLNDSTKWEQLTKDEQSDWLKNHTVDEWNGKKIFEGDIVKVPVYFDCGCYPHTKRITKVVKIPMFYTIAFDGDIEIIGNIHDNSELLKGE